MQPAAFGISGIVAGASIVFFAYIGFDVVATTAEEARNPQRDLPRSASSPRWSSARSSTSPVALVITGMVQVRPDRPQGGAGLGVHQSVGKDGYATLISAGAVAGLTTVVMTLMIGATRVVFAMSRDWLLPAAPGPHQPRAPAPPSGSPSSSAPLVALVASLTPIGKLEEMVNIGTLAAFTLVSIAVPILRKRRPDLKRSFKVPFIPGAADPGRGRSAST